MKKIKSYLLVVMIAFFAAPVSAQQIAVVGGMNMSNVRSDIYDNSDFVSRTRSTPGWHLGMIVDIPVKNEFSIETGAFFTTKGFRVKEDYEYFGVSTEFRYRLMTINFEVPITAKYTWKLKSMDVYALAGPTIGCGVYGNTKVRMDDGSDVEKSTDDVEWGSEDDDYLKRFDLGMKLGGGIRYNNLLAGISYTYGLFNISNGDNNIHNRSFSLTVGYWFGSEE